ncbi:MAG: hypothetical protein ACTIDO_16550 [Brevibacterium aurantiacum]|uniref:hypothetical protein n=1 Tax=Brevibacterium aurantiacum TaxID=273384 RepID=UPI003F915DC4
MDSSGDVIPARIRFDAHDEAWLIATINGTRMPCAPIHTSELDAAIDELTRQLGGRTHVEIHHLDGSIEHRLSAPQAQQTRREAGGPPVFTPNDADAEGGRGRLLRIGGGICAIAAVLLFGLVLARLLGAVNAP